MKDGIQVIGEGDINEEEQIKFGSIEERYLIFKDFTIEYDGCKNGIIFTK